jgi:hypothetical protein
MKKVRYVVGKVEGPLNLADGERVLFAGDCTGWEGNIDGCRVQVTGNYKTTSQVDSTKTKSNDMILKILGSLAHCFRERSSRHIHAKGCPVSVAAHVNYLSFLGKIANVNFHRRSLLPVNLAYWQMRAHRFFNRIFG